MACADQAVHLVETWDKVPNPGWVGDFRRALKSAHKVDPAAVDKIGVSFVLTPKIYAYCFPAENRIAVSAIARNHLRTINFLLWTMAMELARTASQLEIKSQSDLIGPMFAAEDFIDLLLPHLFSLYFNNVNYSSLPIVRAPNPETLVQAKKGALVQVQFMLAHEYAHLLFHNGKSPSLGLETEADAFSYELLFDNKALYKDESGLLLTACRWFFLYLTLDMIIGAVLSGYEVDWVDVPIRNRERWLIEHIRDIRFVSEEERNCQFWGDALLFQAKARLQDRGTEWIRSAAREFEKEHCFSS